VGATACRAAPHMGSRFAPTSAPCPAPASRSPIPGGRSEADGEPPFTQSRPGQKPTLQPGMRSPTQFSAAVVNCRRRCSKAVAVVVASDRVEHGAVPQYRREEGEVTDRHHDAAAAVGPLHSAGQVDHLRPLLVQ